MGHQHLFQPQFQLDVPIVIAILAMLVVITEPHHVMTTHSAGVSLVIVILITQYVIVKTQYVMTPHSAEVALGLDPGAPIVIASLAILVVMRGFHHVIVLFIYFSAEMGHQHLFQPQFQLQWEWVTTDQAGWATTVQVALGLDPDVPKVIATLATLVVIL